MMETLSVLPMTFWLVIAVLAGGALYAWRQANEGIGLPMLAVLGTATAWYVGDALYNDYAGYHVRVFTSSTLDGAWLQVVWFLLVFLVASPILHRQINAKYLGRGSGVIALFKNGVGYPLIQRQLNMVFKGAMIVWVSLFFIAFLKLRGEIIYYLFPFLGHAADAWSHGQVGSGFDCLSIVAVYFQLLSATMFGVVLALAMDRRIRAQALIFCLLSWSFFIFDRNRNTMLAMAIPAILSWVFLRLRGNMLYKGVVLLAFFMVVNMWMKFIIANRSNMAITQAFKEKRLMSSSQKKAHNEGLNMFEELCWVSTFIDRGTYHVNWGGRYFAELVNPIPRGLWPGKPLIGLDYAVARGANRTSAKGAVDTTVSTGFIGQGVVNFGRILGPAAAALLMALWVAWLARLDLNIQALGRLPLYSLGLILTFNLGRDITLITIYPFLFGAAVIWFLDYYARKTGRVGQGQPLASTAPVSAEPDAQPRYHPAQPAGGMRFALAESRARGGFVKRTLPPA